MKPGRGPRPPWWPEGETWPPPHGGGFARRLGCLVGGFVLFMFVASSVAFRFFDTNDDGEKWGPPFPLGALFALVIFTTIAVVVSRFVRRAATPIGEVMEAADRIAAGDYSARVTPRGTAATRQLAVSFNQMTARLESDETRRRQLLADVAHELRTPLAVIRGNLEGMIDGVYPRDDAHLGPVIEETAVMERLLDDLRTLSLTEAGVLQLHREPTAIGELLAEIAAAHRPRADAAGVTLLIELIETPAMPDLLVDSTRLRQIIDNLVVNALRYTPTGGTIRLAATSAADAVTITVVDTGRGIAPADLPFIFDRFRKSVDSGGSGLGLAIAKRLTEAHGGEIVAASAVDRGTTMIVRLPRTRQHDLSVEKQR